MIRPEAARALNRWREAATGVGVLALGLWWALGTGGLLAWVGWALVAAGGALAVAGVQRGLLRRSGGGPGLVQVTEGRIVYFGPLGGGAAALSELSALHLIRGPGGGLAWVLDQPAEPALVIPLDAEGADALMDLLGSLPGLSLARLVAATRRPPQGRMLLWQRGPDPTVAARVH